ncbi:MAG: hypothetical protein COV34_02025 [Candidatus Zambryskibacteria bacterium CG10_big_fil_rev_8_21_14_0_10_42_12]|uniref:Endolytic murein transglycosylase n=1 Tax=Candidatus Zambryskibacteria bacterium CG10_big_fil_rev_8_21_14_0_10_42_12 TaxID=1975115 RepID=A0A2H0QVQ8_9BACT|nr:MAG: hypothetical protein COV34_02025 [Candidatus Zambryskibacteria bacterium CG10_big_fil_rev_8_21_14_0_10_42_12]
MHRIRRFIHKLQKKLDAWLTEERREYILIHKYHPRATLLFAVVAIIISSGVFIYGTWLRPPRSFPLHSFITIKEGGTLREAAQQLRDQGVIRSARLFTYAAKISGREQSVIAGEYFLRDPENSLSLMWRIATGDYGIEPEKLVIPEGSDVYDIAEQLAETYQTFDPIDFLSIAQPYEGYLFPDTYYVYPNLTAEEALNLFRSNFEKQIFDIADEIEEFGKPLDEVLIVASIVEREANKKADRETIAGIIWRRLEIGMPLQVDVTFRYINGKHTYNLTRADLLEDNPYNTYVNKGLPPTPIANPSLESILATVNPRETNYLFFLADRRYRTYFSETYEEHLRKKRLYVD